MKIISQTYILVGCFLSLFLCSPCIQALDIYVAKTGNYKNPGTKELPFITIAQAKSYIRKIKTKSGLPPEGITVWISEGIYEQDYTFSMHTIDSGNTGRPIVYRSIPGHKVIISGGKYLKKWDLLTDPLVLNLLPKESKGKVWTINLKNSGVKYYGDLLEGWGISGSFYAMFYNNKFMELARYPNKTPFPNEDKSTIRISKITGKSQYKYRGLPTSPEAVFQADISIDRLKRWQKAEEAYLNGYWKQDWASQRQPIKSITPQTQEIRLGPPYHKYGYRKGQWFYAFNILSELDSPGEWYLDRKKGFLYFWPPAPEKLNTSMFVKLPKTVTMDKLSNVTFKDIIFEGAAHKIIGGKNCRNIKVTGCTFRNSGGCAISFSACKNVKILGCDIYNCGSSGIEVNGGNLVTLEPSGHLIENNNIHHYGLWAPMYHPGIMIKGVGSTIRRNAIHHAPHFAIFWRGNNHMIELNNIYAVCSASNDAGAIYNGRSFIHLGNVIRYNYLHSITGYMGHGAHGVYFDDSLSGNTILGNIFYKVQAAILTGGGHHNLIENNIFIKCQQGIVLNIRPKANAEIYKKEAIKVVDKPLWKGSYPQLKEFLKGDLHRPQGSIICRNILYNTPAVMKDIDPRGRSYIKMYDNLTSYNPHFSPEKFKQFKLNKNCILWQKGFKRIPVEKIGLYKSTDRMSLPPHINIEVHSPQVKSRPCKIVRKRKSIINIDGKIQACEWDGLKANDALCINKLIGCEAETRFPSFVWLRYDDKGLWGAVKSLVNPQCSMHNGNIWGKNDALEIALHLSEDKTAAPLVIWGFTSGNYKIRKHPYGALQVREAISANFKYAADVSSNDSWQAEFFLPFSALFPDGSIKNSIDANFSFRKTGDNEWVVWQNTAGKTWSFENSGTINFMVPKK